MNWLNTNTMRATCAFHPRSNEPYISSGAVRVSEYVEVEFTPRDQKEIDAARRVIYTVKREKLQRELAKLDEA